MGALFGGQAFAIPPLVKYGKDWMKRDLVPALYSGTQTAALAISEPHAGSDVQNITTTARLSDDGKHFIVNGEKKVGSKSESATESLGRISFCCFTSVSLRFSSPPPSPFARPWLLSGSPVVVSKNQSERIGYRTLTWFC